MSFILNKFNKINLTFVRYFKDSRPYEPFFKKPILNRRYGYKSKYHERGLMPRLKDQNNVVKSSFPYRKLQFSWHHKNTYFGQNDYVDILENDSLRPHELLREVPWWLRGFKGNELQKLQRQQAAVDDKWRWNRPQKWYEIQKRIDFLYKYYNYRYTPRKPEKY